MLALAAAGTPVGGMTSSIVAYLLSSAPAIGLLSPAVGGLPVEATLLLLTVAYPAPAGGLHSPAVVV
jgi:hypothetical protein